MTTRDRTTYVTRPPVLRRAAATGEFPFHRPASVGDVDQLARQALEATLVHAVPLPPIDSLPDAVRRPAPTVHGAEAKPARRPFFYRGQRRKAGPPREAPLWPLLVLPLAGNVLVLLAQVALLAVAIRVSGAVL
jgi:hypothetical protein